MRSAGYELAGEGALLRGNPAFVLGSLDPAVASSDEVGVIERSTTMHAGAQRVWRDILDVPDIAPKDIDQAWLYRIGVPLPKSGISGQRDGRPVRRVTMGKNVYFDEVITDWDEGRHCAGSIATIRTRFRRTPSMSTSCSEANTSTSRKRRTGLSPWVTRRGSALR